MSVKVSQVGGNLLLGVVLLRLKGKFQDIVFTVLQPTWCEITSSIPSLSIFSVHTKTELCRSEMSASAYEAST